tara:strand:+ start:31 stop:723 length:693 start_codon:yes stop_codon:yes gene_type:complete
MASIKLKHASGNSTILNSPAANPSADVTLKLPSTTGSAGQVLQVASANHSSTNAELEFAAAAAGGKILKVLQDTKTDVQSFTVSNSGQYGTILGTISGLSQAITLSNASHKVLVQGFVSLGSSYSYNTSIGISLERDGSQIPAATGDADGNRRRQMFTAQVPSGTRGPTPFHFQYLDTPGNVGPYTYTIEVSHQYAGVGNYYVNRGGASDNDIYNTRGISVITVMEVDPT